MPTEPRQSTAYHGPVVCLTLPESTAVARALRHGDPEDAQLLSALRKIDAALHSDPTFRTPAK